MVVDINQQYDVVHEEAGRKSTIEVRMPQAPKNLSVYRCNDQATRDMIKESLDRVRR